jgi:ADP-heptose:LPS heptosyltransferase
MISRLLRGSRPPPDSAVARAEPARVRRVLAIKVHDQLGDYLVATPALNALRRRYPAARLALATRAMIAPLALRNPDLDRVIVLPRVRVPLDLARQIAALAAVAAFRPDLALVLNSVSRSKTADGLARLSGARLIVGRSRVLAGPLPADMPAVPLEGAIATARAGAGTRDPVYDLDLGFARTSEHQVDRYLDLVRWTGAGTDAVLPVLVVTEEERRAGMESLQRVAAGVASPRPWIGLHAGTGDLRKCWPLDRFVELGAHLGEAGGTLWVFDTPKERGRAERIRSDLDRRIAAVRLVPPGPIERFAAQCAALDLLVCNDSGVMHIAAALGVATLSFHSLGRPAEWAPRRAEAVALYAPGAADAISLADAKAAATRLLAAQELQAPQYM